MSSPRPELLVAPCSYQAAKYAVEKWHYSKRMPKSKLNHLGVWENNVFIGAVIFGVGATADMMMQFGLDKWQGCELVRVALQAHEAPVTKIISIAIKHLVTHSPKLRLIVSYADPEQDHVGAIYQAGNWIYTGRTAQCDEYIVNGKRWHGRALRHEKPAHVTTKQYLEMQGDYEIVKGSSKYRYCYPLDRAMRRQIAPLAQPYPKRDVRPVNGDDLATREAGRFDSEPGALVDSHD